MEQKECRLLAYVLLVLDLGEVRVMDGIVNVFVKLLVKYVPNPVVCLWPSSHSFRTISVSCT